MLALLLALVVAVTLDRWLGEPRRWHPLVGFGRLAAALEVRLNRAQLSATQRRWRGLLAWMLLLLPATLLVAAWPRDSLLYWPLAVLLLYLALGGRSLRDHCRAVAEALRWGDLALARKRVALIVSRDCQALDREGVARAALESALENGSDAVFAPLFWFALAGPGGVVLYRLANTLDAMWGYRSQRFADFGWASARLDDLLNYLPARLLGVTFVLCKRSRSAWRCWRQQARHCASPNGGVVMCSGAGALGLRLGGGASYRGRWRASTVMGEGRAPDAADIERALRLLDAGVVLWLLVLLGFTLLLYGLAPGGVHG